MRLIDKFEPNTPKNLQKRHLVSTFIYREELPTIEMKIHQMEDVKYKIQATVKFNFVILKDNETFTRIIDGVSEDVYTLAAKQAAKISLSLSTKFNDAWQKTLMQLLNNPSKNKSILNLGVYKKDSYGLYDVTDPSVMLDAKIIESGLKLKDVAALSGIDETTLFRHLKGTSEISRETAIRYAKTLGCDPAEILFNSLNIPVWGSTDTQEMKMVNKFTVFTSEITSTKEIESVKVPREIYRPDVKAILIDSPNSVYHGHTAFYYNTNAPIVFENQMVILGTKSVKNFSDGEKRMRYFIGIYKKNKNGKTVDLHTIDADVIDISFLTPDEDTNTFEDFVGVQNEQKIVIDDITPEFVAPIVALVDNSKIYDPIKTAINKTVIKTLTKNRKEDFKSKEYFNILKNTTFSLEEEKRNSVIGAKLIKAMELNKNNQKVIDEAIYKLQEDEEPNLTPEEAAK